MDKETALQILETIIAGMKGGAVRDALAAVHEYIKNTFVNDYSMTPQEREKRIIELLDKADIQQRIVRG